MTFLQRGVGRSWARYVLHAIFVMVVASVPVVPTATVEAHAPQPLTAGIHLRDNGAFIFNPERDFVFGVLSGAVDEARRTNPGWRCVTAATRFDDDEDDLAPMTIDVHFESPSSGAPRNEAVDVGVDVTVHGKPLGLASLTQINFDPDLPEPIDRGPALAQGALLGLRSTGALDDSPCGRSGWSGTIVRRTTTRSAGPSFEQVEDATVTVNVSGDDATATLHLEGYRNDVGATNKGCQTYIHTTDSADGTVPAQVQIDTSQPGNYVISVSVTQRVQGTTHIEQQGLGPRNACQRTVRNESGEVSPSGLTLSQPLDTEQTDHLVGTETQSVEGFTETKTWDLRLE